MSDSAKSPVKESAVADESVSHPTGAPVGEVSGAKIEVTDAEGIPAPESKEDASVTDVKKDEDSAADKAAAPADEAKSEHGADKKEDAEAPNADDAPATPAAPASTNKNARRKSSGGTAKKLNKKQSRASMAHLDAKAGDYYFIKMKGYPKWPGIVASEDMLPESITSKRPVSAARPDGTYREDFQDGGKRVLDRTFPCMFLATNEFCWAVNTDLEDLDVTTVGTLKGSKMTKALQEAHALAAENHDLQYFKDLLDEHALAHQQELEELAAEEAAREAAEAARLVAAKTPKKAKKAKSDGGDDEDVEMGEADEEAKPKSSKKRKADADDTATPKGADSVKKPKLKLTHTPKSNGTDTPKAAKEKKAAKPKKKANGAAVPEPEEDPEVKRQKKEKEILYFRHKLQKGLLAKDGGLKDEEIPAMAEYITKLEGYADLEVSIIKATKIHKVLKAILKLPSIPRDEEFKFKARSTELLGKWTKTMDSEPAGNAAAQANGTSNGDAKPEAEKASEAAEPEKADVEMADASKTDEAKATEPAAKADDAIMEDAPAADADVSMGDADDKGEEKLEVEEPKTDAAEGKDEASAPAAISA